MGVDGPGERKLAYFERMTALFDENNSVLLAHADFVGSKQLQSIRQELRPMNATVLMGKNTIMRKVIRAKMADKPELEQLLPYIISNVGLIFCNDSQLSDIYAIIKKHRVGAPAKPGVYAPLDVTVPAGDTGLDPSQTSFFQSLSIQTKINKGQVQILKDVQLIKEGDKIGTSEAALLIKLNIKPFTYGLELTAVFDNGSMYEPKVLALSEDDLVNALKTGIAAITSISLATSVPTVASFSHVFRNAYKNVVAVALGTDYVFEQVRELKELLDNPEALAAASAAAAAPAAGGGGGAKESKKEEAKKEESESEDEDMGFGLFD